MSNYLLSPIAANSPPSAPFELRQTTNGIVSQDSLKDTSYTAVSGSVLSCVNGPYGVDFLNILTGTKNVLRWSACVNASEAAAKFRMMIKGSSENDFDFTAGMSVGNHIYEGIIVTRSIAGGLLSYSGHATDRYLNVTTTINTTLVYNPTALYFDLQVVSGGVAGAIHVYDWQIERLFNY